MQDHEIIRTRADGSIDTAFYMARGREMRSAQAHRMAGSGGRRTIRPLALLTAFFAVIFTGQGQI
jgi:hypothetical protein